MHLPYYLFEFVSLACGALLASCFSLYSLGEISCLCVLCSVCSSFSVGSVSWGEAGVSWAEQRQRHGVSCREEMKILFR